MVLTLLHSFQQLYCLQAVFDIGLAIYEYHTKKEEVENKGVAPFTQHS